MGAVQPWHWIVVIVVLVILFGSKKLPDAARGLGRSMRIFKSEMGEMVNEDKGKDKKAAADAPRELPAADEQPGVTSAGDATARKADDRADT